MKPPKYTRHANIVLSPGQSAEHQLGIVSAIVHREKGDGFVENSTANGHLSGVPVLWRINNNATGPHHNYQFVPFDNLISQYREVKASNQAELDQIEGKELSSGEHVPGELEKLRTSRELLSLWLSLPEDARPTLGRVYGDMSDERALARNVFNIMIRDLSETMRDLKDSLGRYNPTVIMTKSHPLERQVVGRRNQAAKVKEANELRGASQFDSWIRYENDQLAQADEILANYRDEDDLDQVKSIAGRIKFRGAIFNQLAYNLNSTGCHVKDLEVLTTTRHGMQFHRAANYLMLPFRQIAAHPKEVFNDDNVDEATLDIFARLDYLGSMVIGEPYHELINRLSSLGDMVLRAMNNALIKDMQTNANKFNWLVNFLCYAGNDPQQEKWYRYQLK